MNQEPIAGPPEGTAQAVAFWLMMFRAGRTRPTTEWSSQASRSE